MSIRKTLAIVLVLMMLLTCGCQAIAVEKATEEPAEVSEVGDVEITDPDELEALWSNYLYLGIATVFNTQEYSSVSDIDANRIIQYCWKQYMQDTGEEAAKKKLESVSEESRSLYFPMETAVEYMEKYFDTQEVNLQEMDEAYYDEEKEAFTFSPHVREIPSYMDNNAWGIVLDKAVRREDGSVAVELVQYAGYERDLVERIYTVNLDSRDDGSYYFVSGGWEFVDNDSVTLIGDYQELGPLDERFTQVIGETEEFIVMGSKDAKVALFLLDKETCEVVKELKMEYPGRTEVDEASVIMYYPDRIDVYDWSFVLEDTIELPDSMTSVVEEERIMGMDLSTDHQEVVYADREGMKLYHPQSESEGMVIETLPAQGEYPDGRTGIRYFYNPRFVAGGSKVVATLSGYDYNSGFISYNLFDSSYEVFDEYLEGIDTSNVYYDNGMLYQIETVISIDEIDDQDESTWGYRLRYYDFTSSETAESTQELIGGNMDYVLFQDMLYNGSSHVAFLTISSNRVSHINRLDLDSGTVKGNLFSAEGAQVSIMGVLQDGRILCGYNRNPAENGLVIVP